MAVIYIKDLVIEAKHGFHQSEKDHAQRFVVNVELTVDNAKAGASDDLADTLNWSQIRDTIVNTVQNNSFNLIERLVQEVADQLMFDKRVRAILISIDKPDAFKTGVPGIRLQLSRAAND